MSKKVRVSPVAAFEINTEIVAGDLPIAAAVNETVAQLTGKVLPQESESKAVKPIAETQKSIPAKVEKAKPKTPKTTVEGSKPLNGILTRVEKMPANKKIPQEEKVKAVKIEEIKMHIKYGRPQKEIAAGRTKFTTMLQPDLVKQLKRTAIDSGVTVADLLENVLGGYFDNAKI